VTQIPIACTLSATEKTTRGDEWRQFLAANVTEAVRVENVVRMRLIDGDEVILRVVDLARREKDCCAFFEFRLELLPDEVWLEMAAPADAWSLLDAFVESGAS
jgi:MerR family copper efflux transcriptional regulator